MGSRETRMCDLCKTAFWDFAVSISYLYLFCIYLYVLLQGILFASLSRTKRLYGGRWPFQIACIVYRLFLLGPWSA